jgi:hypothetical protein
VLDPTGATIPGASVSAVNTATKVNVKTSSVEDGSYSLPFLIPGVYRLQVTTPGFQTLVRDGLELRISERLLLDVTMQLGAASETITVREDTPLLQTASASLGQVIDAKRVAELPTRDGSPFSLVFLSPGALSLHANASSLQAPIFLQNTSSEITINGSPRGSTEFTLDGVSNMQTNYAAKGSGIINSPPADLVQEFKMETAFDASVGHTSGAIVNFSLKSGTNKLHATALLSHRDPEWQANSFIANRASQPRANFYYDRWSATATGPVRIPKIYNGADRTFFSFGYEEMHFGTPGGAFIATVPTAPQLAGDFSQLLQVGSQYQIYDPATIRPAANGRYSRSPFPGNLIPQSRFDPVGLAIAKSFPAPTPGITPRADGANNFAKTSYTDPRYYYNYIWRVDHSISDRQRVYGRFAVNRRKDGPYRKYWDSPFVGETFIADGYQAVLDDVYTLSPTLFMNVRYGFNRLGGGHSPDRLNQSPSKLGLPSATVSQLTGTLTAFPTVTTAGLPNLGGEMITVLSGQNHSAMLNFTKQVGSHSLKFGADVRSYTNYISVTSNTAGSFNFSTAWTQGPMDNSPASPGGLGQGLASLLLGLPAGGGIDRSDNSAATSTYWAAFLHDNWRVSAKLTLDLGLRWEYEGPITERFNRAVRGFDYAFVQPIEAAARTAYAAKPDSILQPDQFRLRGGLTFAGANGQPRFFYDRVIFNFAPRAGFAYAWRKNTIARGGFGVYPIALGIPACGATGGSPCVWQSGYSQNTPLVASLDNGQTFIATLARPYPSGILAPAGNALGARTYLGQGIQFYDTNTRTPYSMRWSMNLQQLLPGEVLIEVGYVGSKSVKLPVSRNLIGTPNQYLSTAPERDQSRIDYLSANIPNPMAGLLPGTGLNGATIQRARLVAAYPQFAGASVLNYQASQWYNSLQLRAERRMTKGFTVIGSYTFSKLLEATSFLNGADPTPTQFVSSSDRPHVARISSLFELPVGRGKNLLSGANRVLDGIAGGWTLGAVWFITSGPPVLFSNPLLRGTAADVVLSGSERTLDRWFNIDAFEKSAAKQLSWNRVAVTPYLGVRGDYETQFDLSVLKKVRIKEGFNLEFRGEFINAPNHPTLFAPPNASPTSTAFGTVTAMNGTPRVVQVMLKLAF